MIGERTLLVEQGFDQRAVRLAGAIRYDDAWTTAGPPGRRLTREALEREFARRYVELHARPPALPVTRGLIVVEE